MLRGKRMTLSLTQGASNALSRQVSSLLRTFGHPPLLTMLTLPPQRNTGFNTANPDNASMMSSATPANHITTSAPSPSTLILPTRSNVLAARILPKHSVPSATFGSSIASTSAFAAASSHGSSLAQQLAESSVNIVYSLATGSSSNGEVVLRSVLSQTQIQRVQQAKLNAAREAGQDEMNAASLDAINTSPIHATCSLSGTGEVSVLECLTDRLIVGGTESGELVLIDISDAEKEQQTNGFIRSSIVASSSSSSGTLRPLHRFSSLHSDAVTSLSAHLSSSTPLLASSSQDGSFSIVSPFTRHVVAQVKNASVAEIQAIKFGSASTVYIGGMGGVISSYDVRTLGASSSSSASIKPSSLLLDPNAASITALAFHATRPFNLAVGSSNGSVSIFDVRMASAQDGAAVRPLCSLQAQRSLVSAVEFLPWTQGTICTTSEDGSCCVFDFSGGEENRIGAEQVTFSNTEATERMKPAKLHQHTTGLNTLTIERDTRTIIAGGDAHAMIVLQGVA